LQCTARDVNLLDMKVNLIVKKSSFILTNQVGEVKENEHNESMLL